MKEKLKKLVADYPKHYTRKINDDPELKEWVEQQTSALPDDTGIAERIYVGIHGINLAICHRGNHKVFNSMNKGYRFCAQGCACHSEQQALNIKNDYANTSEEEKERRKQKQIETATKNHGVANSAQSEQSKESARKTNEEKWDGHSSRNPEVKKKLEKTNDGRYGGHSSSHPEVKEKIKETKAKNKKSKGDDHAE